MTTSSTVAMLLQRPLRIRLIALLVAAVLIAAVAWYVGMDLAHACTVGAVALALGLLWLSAPDRTSATWPREEALHDEGTRHDVTRLSWSLRTRKGRVRADAVTRIRLVAASRLTPYELDLDDAADRDALTRLIGADAYRTLRPAPIRLPYFHDVERCLDALSRLVPADSSIPDPPARPRATTAIGRTVAGLNDALTDILTRRGSR